MSKTKPLWRGRAAGGSGSIGCLKRAPISPCAFLDYGLSFPRDSGQFSLRRCSPSAPGSAWKIAMKRLA